jgi:hypothetical protein
MQTIGESSRETRSRHCLDPLLSLPLFVDVVLRCRFRCQVRIQTKATTARRGMLDAVASGGLIFMAWVNK